jgi:hypothetical protein
MLEDNPDRFADIEPDIAQPWYVHLGFAEEGVERHLDAEAVLKVSGFREAGRGGEDSRRAAGIGLIEHCVQTPFRIRQWRKDARITRIGFPEDDLNGH